ncbi:MAG: DinB family protein [Taibaiella sp.]|nr:DinB family protein [Taibaiella sp.]
MNATSVLKIQFDLQTRLFRNTLLDIADEETNDKFDEGINSIKWLAGHLLNTRVSGLAKIAGVPSDDSYVAMFGRGSKWESGGDYPTIETIMDKWESTSSAISAGLAALPDEVLQAKAPAQGPIADETILGLLSFLMHHEAYHIGQLGILRKMAGREAMSFA